MVDRHAGRKLQGKGVQEWVPRGNSINPSRGCYNGCVYCYARFMAHRFGWKILDEHGNQIGKVTWDNWTGMHVNHHVVNKRYRHREARSMLPTSSDIIMPVDLQEEIDAGTEQALHDCFDGTMSVLEKQVKAGNEILLVSKLRLPVARYLQQAFHDFKHLIEVRVTITTLDDEVRKQFEPCGPPVEERLAAIKYLHEHGWDTSASIEPRLDVNIFPLVKAIKEVTSGYIWIGSMSFLPQVKGKITAPMAARLDKIYNESTTMEIYEALKDDPRVEFKSSFMSSVLQAGNGKWDGEVTCE